MFSVHSHVVPKPLLALGMFPNHSRVATRSRLILKPFLSRLLFSAHSQSFPNHFSFSARSQPFPSRSSFLGYSRSRPILQSFMSCLHGGPWAGGLWSHQLVFTSLALVLLQPSIIFPPPPYSHDGSTCVGAVGRIVSSNGRVELAFMQAKYLSTLEVGTTSTEVIPAFEVEENLQ